MFLVRIFTIVAYIFFCLLHTVLAVEITYDIYHHPQKLNILVKFLGDNSGTTQLSIPQKMWGHDASKQINNIKVLKNSAVLKNSNLLHKEGAHVTISYDINNVDIPCASKYYYTRSLDEGFFLLHDLSLIYPKHLASEHTNVVINYHSNNASNFFFLEK